MSDYLTTLAARSLNLLPIAAPRVPSLFEPFNGAERTTGEAAFSIETSADAPMGADAPTGRQVPHRPRGLQTGQPPSTMAPLPAPSGPVHEANDDRPEV